MDPEEVLNHYRHIVLLILLILVDITFKKNLKGFVSTQPIEFVSYVFLKIQKTRLFTFFEATFQKT